MMMIPRMELEEETNPEDTKDQVCSIYQREVSEENHHCLEDLLSCTEEEEWQSICLGRQGIGHPILFSTSLDPETRDQLKWQGVQEEGDQTLEKTRLVE